MFKLPDQGKEFLENFQKTHTINSDPGFVVIFAESMKLITEAVEKGNTTNMQIKAYLESITPDNKRT
jgi:hypothetical protein